MTPPTLSKQIAEFVLDIRDADIPSSTRERAAYLVLDAVGLAAATAERDFAQCTLRGLQMLSDEAGRVPVLTTPYEMSARNAALMNGLLIHGLDFDDTHPRAVLHPTAAVLPALVSSVYLPASIKRDLSGRDFLSAYILGVEVACFIGSMASGAFHERGFHPTAVAGIFGCVAAAGRLAGLNVSELVHAQGLALSFASGSLEFLEDGAWNKRYHPGWAAQSALTAIALARGGAIGATDPYAGRHGALSLFTGLDSANLPAVDFADRTGWATDATAVKPFPACHFTHACIDAALILRQQGVEAREINHITALMPAPTIPIVCEPEAKKKRPASSYDAQFSIPYLVAAAFINGRLTTAEVDGAHLEDAAILDLASRVNYEVDPHSTFPAAYSGELIVALNDGRTLRHREETNRGAACRPLSAEEIVLKFQDNSAARLAARSRQVQDMILGIDEVPSVRLALQTLRFS